MRQLTASPALRAALQLGLRSCRNGSSSSSSLVRAAAAPSHRRSPLLLAAGGSRSSSSSSNSPAAVETAPTPPAAAPPPPSSPSSALPLAAIAEAVNPPASTRPPPLGLPEPDPKAPAMKRVFGVGKAYLTFYKNGLRAIVTNYRLRSALQQQQSIEAGGGGRASPSPSAAATPPRQGSRAALHLLLRARHDLNRVPVFLLIFAVFVELTPFVAVLVPRLVPMTCRIPKQTDLLQRQTEERRGAAFKDLSTFARLPGTGAAVLPAAPSGSPAAPAAANQTPTTAALAIPESQKALELVDRHIARSIGLIARAWERIGWVPAQLARARVGAHLGFLATDDRLMLEAAAAAAAVEAVTRGEHVGQQAVVDAAVEALVDDEVRIACTHRGIDVRGKPSEELRFKLAHWLRLVADARGSADGIMRELLLSRPDSWPLHVPRSRKEKVVLHMPLDQM